GARADLTLAGAVIGDEKAKTCVQDEMHVAVKINRVSSMPNDPVPVAALFIETQGHGIQLRRKSALARVHLLGGLRAENLSVLKFSILQVRDHEAREIRRGRRQAARRRRNDDLKRLGMVRSGPIS